MPPRESTLPARSAPAASAGMIGGSPFDERDDMTLPMDNDELMDETDVDLGRDDDGGDEGV